MSRARNQESAFSHPHDAKKQSEEYFPRQPNPDKDVVERICWISLIPYIVSFVLPAFSPGPKGEEFVSGFFAFYASFFTITKMPAWLANPTLWVAVIVIRRRPFVAIGLGSLSCLFSWSFLVFFLLEKNGPITPRIGYFVWCSSFVFFTLGALIAVAKQSRRSQETKLGKFQFGIRSLLFTVVGVALAVLLTNHLLFEGKRFDAEKWKIDKQSRKDMVNDLVRRHRLVGMRHDEMLALLGGYDMGDSDSNYVSYQVPGGDRLILQFAHDIDHRERSNEIISVTVGWSRFVEQPTFRWPYPVNSKPKTDLKTAYNSLKLNNLKANYVSNPEGSSVRLYYDIKNASPSVLNSHATVGRCQHWILHPDGHATNVGVWAIPRRLLDPGECYPAMVQQISMLGYVPGQYKFIVELQTVDGTEFQTGEVSFSVTR